MRRLTTQAGSEDEAKAKPKNNRSGSSSGEEPVASEKTKRKANIARTNSKDKAKEAFERKRSKSAEKSLEKTLEEVDELRQSQLIMASTSFLAGITGQVIKSEAIEEEPKAKVEPVKVKAEQPAKPKEEELESSRNLESSRKETKRKERESVEEPQQTKSLEDKYASRC